jgi:peptide/nickel transport system ATP-binding protein
LIEPTSGSVKYNGEELVTLGAEAMRQKRRDLQIIFQDPYSSLNPRMKVGKAILEPMQVHKIEANNTIRKEKVIDLMETVGLKAEQFDRYPHEFSGGQRQRVCIARALAMNPKFIICDESVSALDVSVQAQVLNLLNELKTKFSFTYIFISHDLSVVKYMSDRMVVMKEGQIEEMGIVEDIYLNPQSEYTQWLIEAIPKIRF